MSAKDRAQAKRDIILGFQLISQEKQKPTPNIWVLHRLRRAVSIAHYVADPLDLDVEFEEENEQVIVAFDPYYLKQDATDGLSMYEAGHEAEIVQFDAKRWWRVNPMQPAIDGYEASIPELRRLTRFPPPKLVGDTSKKGE